MSQDIYTEIDPADSGDELAVKLNDFKDAIVSGLSGTTRPTELDPGGGWIDTTNSPTSWSYRVWTGTDDVEVFTINLTTGVAAVALAVDSFIVKKISADSVGAVMEMVKQRIANNGQVADGDVVGEIRFVGRTDASGNPVVGRIKWVSTDAQTTSAYGGYLSFTSTAEGANSEVEHFRLVDGVFETLVPHKVHAQILVNNNVATSATITQLAATKILVEMTGATATEVQGIKSDDPSQFVIIHNRSSALVSFMHEDVGATAEDRMTLPNNEDYALAPESTVTFFYCTTDERWKLVSTADRISGFTVETHYGASQTWVAPASVSAVRLRAFRAAPGIATERNNLIDPFMAAYAWGLNTNGQLAVGDVAARSSPVAVLGGFNFLKTWGSTGAATSAYGLAINGQAYAWGINANGQLGHGNVTPKSSPIAVLGGLTFLDLYPRDTSVFGLTTNNSLYAWGMNTNGQLGHGNVTPKSSPIAVLGSLSFARVLPLSAAAGAGAVAALTTAGVPYAWGINSDGALGVGDVTPRSSPVAVLGSLTLLQLGGGGVSNRYFFNGLDASGAAYAWGNNSAGQLGLGDTTNRSSPVAVIGGIVFKRLITHPKSESVFGLTDTGVLYSWGDNSQGVLGLGDIANRSSPVPVLGGLSFAKVKLFRSMAAGLTSDGTLYVWGANGNGQLAQGDVVSRSSPVAVLGGLKFTDVAWADGLNDQYSVYATLNDGTIYAWGANANGTLGLGDVVPRSSPIAVLGINVANSRETMETLDLTVTPGASYTLNIGPGIVTFGATAVARDAYKVEIQYVV